MVASKLQNHKAQSDHFDTQVFNDMITSKAPVVVSSRDVDFSFATHIMAYDHLQKTLKLKNTIPLDHIHHLAHKSSFMLSIPLVNVHTTAFSGDGVDFIFPINRIEKIHSVRQFHRVKPVNAQVWFLYTNPYDGQTSFKKKVLTISEGGLSFESTFQSFLLYPGQKFPASTILLNDKVIGSTSFKTVYIKQHFDHNTQEKFQVGVKFDQSLPKVTSHFL